MKTMKKNNLAIIQFIGSLAVLIGAVLKFVNFEFANYVFAGGAVLLFVMQIVYLIKSNKDDIREQRLHRLMILATSLLGVASYFMFVRGYSWIPFVLAYAVVSLYLSYRAK